MPSPPAPSRFPPFVPSEVEGHDARERRSVTGWTSLALLLAACSSPDQPANTTAPANALARAEAQQETAAEDDGRILCARGPAELARTCTVEQSRGQDGLVLTLRHPDGGFRRLRVATDGRGVVAADGAETAKVAILGPGDIEVVVGDDRYRLPATVKR